MSERRKPTKEVTPRYEDSGLFKTPVSTFRVDLIPKISRNKRNDVIVQGYLDGYSIDVIFAGRRKNKVKPLLHKIKANWSQVNRDLGTRDAPDANDVRLPVSVEGSWRAQYSRDETDWQTHRYQLFVARWVFADVTGQAQSFGEPPQL